MKKIINIILTAIIVVSFFSPVTNVKASCIYQLARLTGTTRVNLDCYGDYDTARGAMNALTLNTNETAVIYDGSNTVVNARHATVRFQAGSVIYLYPTATSGTSYTAIHTSYGADAAFLDYDQVNNRIKIRISGYTGWTPALLFQNSLTVIASSLNVRTSPTTTGIKIGSIINGYITNFNRIVEDSSGGAYVWYEIVYNGQVAYIAEPIAEGEQYIKENSSNKMRIIPIYGDNYSLQTYYKVGSDRDLMHYIIYYSGSTIATRTMRLSVAPSFLETNVNYYSFDGNYFYTNISKMLDDYKNGNFNNAINKENPYYSYYKYLPTRSKTGYEADDFNNVITNKGYTKNRDLTIDYYTYDYNFRKISSSTWS
jgi:hypothetical protein